MADWLTVHAAISKHLGGDATVARVKLPSALASAVLEMAGSE